MASKILPIPSNVKITEKSHEFSNLWNSGIFTQDYLRNVSWNPFIFEFKYKLTNNHFSFNVRIKLLPIPLDNTFLGFCLNIDTKYCLTSGQVHGQELTYWDLLPRDDR